LNLHGRVIIVPFQQSTLKGGSRKAACDNQDRGHRQNRCRADQKPATGEEHRARIGLPNGFEYKEAEMANTVDCRVSAGDKLTFELKNSYAQLKKSRLRGKQTRNPRSRNEITTSPF
jgi:hypothetical protein